MKGRVGLIFVVLGLGFVHGFMLTPKACHRPHKSWLKAGIDVSGLQVVPMSDDLRFPAQSLDIISSNNYDDIQSLLIIATAAAYFLYESRPRGAALTELVEVRRSSVPNANMGVFSKGFIPEGTVIGIFPGFVVDIEKTLAKKSTDDARKKAQKYIWSLTEELALDPTNNEGNLEIEIQYLFGLVKVNTMMARVNEPPKGSDCNVCTKITGSNVEFIAERDISTNEELFIDYGEKYDRSDYGSKTQSSFDAVRIGEKLREEEAMMTLEPITAHSPSGSNDEGSSVENGFLSKLSNQKEIGFKKAGILTPEEGASMFSKMGTAMFGSDEDKELIESIVGTSDGKKNKKSGILGPEDALDVLGGRLTGPEDKDLVDSLFGRSEPSSGTNSNGLLTPAAGAAMFGGGGSGTRANEDADILKSLVDQMGTENMKNFNAIPDIGTETDSSTDIGSGAVAQGESPSKQSQSAQGIADSRRMEGIGSSQDILELQNRLDAMSDDQVKAVFAKLRARVANKLRDSVASAFDPSAVSSLLDKTSPRRMPRAQVRDPAARSKYSSELAAIEEELEKIYQDPLSAWQEMVTNPQKYKDADISKLVDEETEFQ